MSQLLLASEYQIGYSALTSGFLQAANGDYVIVGRLFDPNLNSSAFALRVQPNGVITWEKNYTSAFSVFFQSITQIADGSFVATGSFFYSDYAGDEYLWVVKLDALGNKIWEMTFGSKYTQNNGYDIAATSDGGFIVTGLILEKGTNKTFTRVLKFDASGTLQWDRKYDGGISHAVIQIKDGGYILSGRHLLPDSLNNNVYILRLNQNGDKVWERIYPDFMIYVLQDSDITETMNGHFVVVAKSVLMKVDSCGNIIWAHQNSAFNLNSVVQTPDGSYAVGGSLIVNNFDHAYVAAIDQAGNNIRWDNTEILFNSGMAQILVNRDRKVTGSGYAPINNNRYLIFLGVFNPVKSLV